MSGFTLVAIGFFVFVGVGTLFSQLINHIAD
jgi:hypothetical protein